MSNDIPKLKVLPIGKLVHQAEFDRAHWHLTVPNDVTIVDMLRPAFWQHYPNTLKSPALIDVMSEDGETDVQLRVMGSDVGMVNVRMRAAFQVRDGEDGGVEAPELPDVPTGYRVRFTPSRQYYVQLDMGGGVKDIVSANHANRELAAHAAIEHARKSGRMAA